MELKKIGMLFMVLIVTGCGGFVKIGDKTTTDEVCRDYNESHETIVDVTNVEFKDATTGESLVDGDFLLFHRFTTLESELTDTWEIFVSLDDTDLFAFNTRLNIDGVTSETSFSGFNRALYHTDGSFSFVDLLGCMESMEGSFYTGCSDVFPTEYSMDGLSPLTITPVGGDAFRFEGSYGFYRGVYDSEDPDSANFIGFHIAFDLIADSVDLEIDYPTLTRSCHILAYKYEDDCSADSNIGNPCPEGYESAWGERVRCSRDAVVSCTKCSVTDENGDVILDGTEAVEMEHETRDSLCQGTKNENWDTLINLSEEVSN